MTKSAAVRQNRFNVVNVTFAQADLGGAYILFNLRHAFRAKQHTGDGRQTQRPGDGEL